MKNYKFTEDWFSADDLTQFLPLQTQKETHILEIGSFEGKSTVWFIDNLLDNPKSSITCIDPWTSFDQKHNSMNSYSENLNNKEQFENILDGFVFTGEYQTFLYNIQETTKRSQVNVIKGFSKVVLPTLITESKKYDIIFIDGNHTAPCVLLDAVMSWELLNVNGYMIFDDYLLFMDLPETLRPKMAIDNFVKNYYDYLEVCFIDNRFVIKKIK